MTGQFIGVHVVEDFGSELNERGQTLKPHVDSLHFLDLLEAVQGAVILNPVLAARFHQHIRHGGQHVLTGENVYLALDQLPKKLTLRPADRGGDKLPLLLHTGADLRCRHLRRVNEDLEEVNQGRVIDN